MQPNAQEKFLRIKHAYNTLMNSESRSKYAGASSDSSWSSSSRESKSTAAEEPFYGFGTEFSPLFCFHQQRSSLEILCEPVNMVRLNG